MKTNVSYYIIVDSRSNKDGLSKIYIRFLYDKKKKDYPLQILWPKEKFDRINELLLPRFQGDPDYGKYNMEIKEAKNRLNKLAIESYYKGIDYPIEDYIKAIKSQTRSTDFALFMSECIKTQHLARVISFETQKKQKSILNNIKQFFGEKIPMTNITQQSILEFDAYYRNIGRMKNTISAYHKSFAKYIRIAQEKGLINTNPYDKVKFGFTPAQRVALTQDQLKKLLTIFNESQLDQIEHEVLRRFLFSCFTGLRISDTHKMTTDHIHNNALKLQPHKTRKTGKTIKIPLPAVALSLIKGITGRLFVPITDQAINRILKRIAAYAELDEDITYHSARDTFGTIFIELGGDIKSLCDLMGHSSTRVTEIYIKMADKRKVQLMNNFDIVRHQTKLDT